MIMSIVSGATGVCRPVCALHEMLMVVIDGSGMSTRLYISLQLAFKALEVIYIAVVVPRVAESTTQNAVSCKTGSMYRASPTAAAATKEITSCVIRGRCTRDERPFLPLALPITPCEVLCSA